MTILRLIHKESKILRPHLGNLDILRLETR
jgi:hypothetical protein